jgi:hypothetical protein
MNNTFVAFGNENKTRAKRKNLKQKQEAKAK